MKVIRVHLGDDGETHFQDVEWPEHPTPDGAFTRTDILKAGETNFATQPPGFFADFHPAPSRRLVTVVSGSAEVTVSDGETRVLRAGDVVLFEDVTGPGHTMRTLGDEPRVALHVSLT